MLIGVWAQPARDAAKWKARGITHFINGRTPEPSNLSRADHAKLLADAGLKWMMQASADPKADAALPGFAGFTQPDEPDGWNHLVKKPDGTFDLPASIKLYQAEYERLKAAVPSAPVFGNFTGSQFTASTATSQPINITHFANWFRWLDWVSCDWYLTNTGRPVDGYLRATIGRQMDRMIEASGGKPAFACIECSNQRLQASSREPTPAEFNAMVWLSVARGASGVWYFPQQISGGFQYDAMSSTLAETMTQTNAQLQRLSGFITKGQRVCVQDGSWDVATFTLNGSKLVVRVNTAQPLTVEIIEPIQPDALAQKIAALEQRVAALEQRPQAVGCKLIFDK